MLNAASMQQQTEKVELKSMLMKAIQTSNASRHFPLRPFDFDDFDGAVDVIFEVCISSPIYLCHAVSGRSFLILQMIS